MPIHTLDQARAAKSKAVALLQDSPIVVGIGIARRNGGYCIKVNVSHAAADTVPTNIDGVPVRVEVVGILTKRAVPATPSQESASRAPGRAGRR